jgi:enterobactin synthetase component F
VSETTAQVRDESLPAIVARWAAATPDAPAVIFEGVTLSYRQLHDRGQQQARYLIASGVKPGDMVGVVLPRSEQWVITLLGIMRTGAAYLPLDPDGPIVDTIRILDEASPTALVAEPEMHRRCARDGCMPLEPLKLDVPLRHPTPDPDLSSPEALVCVLYTSGSTGRPKGLEVTHRSLCHFLRGMQGEWAPAAGDRFLAAASVTFDVTGLELFLPLTVGASVVMASSRAARHPLGLLKLIRQNHVTHVQAAPSLWQGLLACGEQDLRGVHALVGGEALGAELATRLKSARRRDRSRHLKEDGLTKAIRRRR